MVIMVIGILATTGIPYYYGVTTDARTRALFDRTRVFLHACRDRAVARGLTVRLTMTPTEIRAVDSPQLRLSRECLTEETLTSLAQLVFAPDAVRDASGKALRGLPVSFLLPGRAPITTHVLLEP